MQRGGAVLGLFAEQCHVHVAEHQTQVQPGERAERQDGDLPVELSPLVPPARPGMSPQVFPLRAARHKPSGIPSQGQGDGWGSTHPTSHRHWGVHRGFPSSTTTAPGWAKAMSRKRSEGQHCWLLPRRPWGAQVEQHSCDTARSRVTALGSVPAALQPQGCGGWPWCPTWS